MIMLIRKILILMLLMMFLALITSFANSMQPPAVVIIVNNPPADLTIELIATGSESAYDFYYFKSGWEGHYQFYKLDMKSNDNYIFKVTTNGQSFDCTVNQPLKHYNEVFTLDLDTQTLTYGTVPYRWLLLAALRFLLTLLIEAFVFWSFKFREKRSWIIFLLINLVTQGILNIHLSLYSAAHPNMYLIFELFQCEIIIFITEMIAFPLLLKEHSKGELVFYAFMANFISLIVGGYLMAWLLPV